MSFHCRLALATAFVLITGADGALAQTAIVRNAPPGATIEVTMNGGTPSTAKADAAGDATLPVPARTGDTDVQIHVDNCGTTIRVLIVQPGQPAAAADSGCTRKDMWGVYIMRSITTFVVEINGTDSAVFVSQGPPPSAWLRRGDAPVSGLPWGSPTPGLFVSAGAGISSFGEATSNACGTAPTCSTDGSGLGLHLGAEYWFNQYVAAQASFFVPSDISAKGNGDTYRFEMRRKTRIVTLGGKVGWSAGPTRIYGIAGVNRHEATTTTTETVDNRTITVNNVSQVLAGGTQEFAQRTRGWSWVFGGGVELWATKWVGIYGEFTRPKLKGSPINGAEGDVDEQGTFIIGGLRARLWR